MIKFLVTLVVLIGLAGGGYYYAEHSKLLDRFAPKPPDPVPTAKAQVKDLAAFVYTTGQVAPARATDVRSEVSGLVMKVFVKAGDRVKRGDMLVKLDTSELAAQARAGEFQIKTMQLQLEKSKIDFDRNQKLMDKGIIADKDFTDSKIDLELAENSLEVEKAKLDEIQQQILKTDLRAPQDGIVLNLSAKEGEVIVGASSVSSGTVLMQVADLHHLIVDANINEIDVPKLSLNMPVALTFDSIPGLTAKGIVDFISPSAGNGSSSNSNSSGMGGGSSGVSTASSSGVRTFPVEFELDNADPRIKPGITASIKIPVGEAKGAVTVPMQAVFLEDESNTPASADAGPATTTFVYVQTPKGFERRDVTVGLSDDKSVQVKTGLTAGEVVALERPAEGKAAQEAATTKADGSED